MEARGSRLLLDVWRASCRHVEIDESINRIAALIRDEVPADLLLVRRLDIPRMRLETVAVGVCRGATLPRQSVTACAPEQFGELLAWCTRERALRQGEDDRSVRLVAMMAPVELRGTWLAAPLAAENDPGGVLLFLATPPRGFTRAHVRVADALREPIGVALVNYMRLHEISRLREAAEADRRALLSRLDRQDVADAIVGADTGMRSVMQRVAQVAGTDAPVLILGETGTGKEVVARAIHARSRRAKAPIVRVNCGALPPGLIDSELFGHERGSFTGAIGTRKGWFERADGGTLFLDEVGELPPDAQVRLLRILQDGTFERVGGQTPLAVDVRIVAATNRDLQDMVARQTFREDLWYRIGVFPIRIPPLRERREDIPLLAAHFAWRAGKRLGRGPLSLGAHDVDLLVAYSWPGNVRELATVIERAAILGDGRQLRIASALGFSAAPEREAPASGRSDADRRVPGEPGEPASLDAAMVRHIEDALATCYGYIEGPRGAAARLKINPHTLRARMRKLGIDWKRFRQTAKSPDYQMTK